MCDDDWDDYKGSKSCYCGRDEGDGADCCSKCRQYVCSNGCPEMPHLVNTDIGLFCTDCLEDVVLIYPDTPVDFDKRVQYGTCEVPSCQQAIYLYLNEYIHVADKLICRDCLTAIVKKAVEEGEEDDDDDNK